MWSPDLLPRSKLATFFPEGTGCSRPGVAATPPGGGTEELLIHLDRWSPLPQAQTPSSQASGLPSSGLPESEGRPFPVFKDFLWHPGVLDGRLPVRRTSRPPSVCRGVPPHARRDRDPDDDGRRDPRRDWMERFNARGRPCSAGPLTWQGWYLFVGLPRQELHALPTFSDQGARSGLLGRRGLGMPPLALHEVTCG